MRWHGINPVRDHYFIAPHVVIYVGIILLLVVCAALTVYAYKIPLFVFVLFPILSVFDELWHRTFGLELATSPMMFWSPAHWSFGLVMWYVMVVLYRLRIEKNEALMLYMQTLIYVIYPVKFLWYLLVPLAPYSRYESLHTFFSVGVTVVFVLLFVTAYKIHRSHLVALIAYLILANASGAYRLFFIWGDRIYNASSVYAVFFLILLFAIYAGYVTERWYIVWGMLVAVWMHMLVYIVTGGFDPILCIVQILCGGIAGGLYYNLESAVLPVIQKYVKPIQS
jgi:hypothetical protein